MQIFLVNRRFLPKAVRAAALARDRPARVLGVLRVLRVLRRARFAAVDVLSRGTHGGHSHGIRLTAHGQHGQHGSTGEFLICVRVFRVVRGPIESVALLHQPWLAEDEVVHHDDIIAALVIRTRLDITAEDLDLRDLALSKRTPRNDRLASPGDGATTLL